MEALLRWSTGPHASSASLSFRHRLEEAEERGSGVLPGCWLTARPLLPIGTTAMVTTSSGLPPPTLRPRFLIRLTLATVALATLCTATGLCVRMRRKAPWLIRTSSQSRTARALLWCTPPAASSSPPITSPRPHSDSTTGGASLSGSWCSECRRPLMLMKRQLAGSPCLKAYSPARSHTRLSPSRRKRRILGPSALPAASSTSMYASGRMASRRSSSGCPMVTSTHGSAARTAMLWEVWVRKAAPPTSEPGLTTADSGRSVLSALGRSLRRWPCTTM
mmetsp:Transcript_35852/g.91595  ORF Transcript_35852/g.91595 Transcript_35852/m.91595 type:complete len:277 (+) Transcript_35852:1702-2532(+)